MFLFGGYMSINDIKTYLSDYYTDGIIMPKDCIKELFDYLEELKIFRELYPDTDTESSLRNNYQHGVKDFVEYLNNNAFELRHDIELIRKYADRFIE